MLICIFSIEGLIMSTIKKLKTKIHGKNRIIEAAQNEIDQAIKRNFEQVVFS